MLAEDAIKAAIKDVLKKNPENNWQKTTAEQTVTV